MKVFSTALVCRNLSNANTVLCSGFVEAETAEIALNRAIARKENNSDLKGYRITIKKVMQCP